MFLVPLGFYSCEKFQKKLWSRFKVMLICQFWALIHPFAQTKLFEKPLSVSCTNLLAPLIVQNFKNIFRADQELQRQLIFGTKFAQGIVLEYISQYWWIYWLIENEMLKAKMWLWQYNWQHPKAFAIEDIGDFNLWNIERLVTIWSQKLQTCCWDF